MQTSPQNAFCTGQKETWKADPKESGRYLLITEAEKGAGHLASRSNKQCSNPLPVHNRLPDSMFRVAT
jgi:hypothetical protein